jgi:cytidylate kinase
MRHIAISGELGSGKSVVAAAVAASLGAEVLSTGAIHRQIAASRGESALETNLAAEDDEEIDRRIDGELVRRAQQDDPIVFDSRLAWHFVPEALTVHLVVDPAVGAARMLGRSPTDVERYADLEEATARAEDRHASEQRRFLGKYGVDIDRLRNYDVVVDTSVATIEEVAAWVLGFHATPPADGPAVCVAPGRLLPTATTTDLDASMLADLQQALAADPRGTGHLPAVAYERPWFWVVDGHDVVSAAVRGGHHLLRATLRAEHAELLDDGTPAGEAMRSLDPAPVRAWEQAHGFRFEAAPAHLAGR